MEYFTEKISFVVVSMGTILTWLFGAWETGIQILITSMILDFIMGLLCGYKEKKLSSHIGYLGLKKKFSILIVLILAVLLDRLIGQSWVFRTIVIYFYVAMEGISILENAAKLEVPVPNKLKSALIQLEYKNKES